MSGTRSVDATFTLGQEIADALRLHGLEPLLIGGLALAFHHYPRLTEDLDFAVAVPFPTLQRLAAALRDRGLHVTLRAPDANDPLGGVVVVEMAAAYPIEIVNFDNSPGGGFPALVHDALQRASAPQLELPFRVVDVVDLILFKLYSGGPKSEHDILELLVRNPVDLVELRRRCAHYRMEGELDAVLAKAAPR